MSSDCIAIIPARGGSKRIPRKNIREFCGKPIIAYSIEAALKADIFDSVMVSTDDEEIAEISRKYGATIPFMRSNKTADDYATTDDVLIEVLRKYKESGKLFKYFACIYATAPFITAEKLRESYDIFKEKNAKALMSVVSYSFPPQRAMLMDEVTGELRYIYPDDYDKRSQSLAKWYHDAGQFYFYETEDFIRNKGRILSGILPVVLTELEVQDIDDISDWKMAEIKRNLAK